VTAALDDADIPIRKIELTAEGYNITARILPPEATYTDLVWRLTDAGGIDSPLGELRVSEDGLSARITPKGDGEVTVRCSPYNGLDHPAFISQRTVRITGMGKPLIDPYAFVAGGLCNASNTELTNGNERGVATMRDGESHVGFRDLDFGEGGSDTLILPLFPLDGAPFMFEIWEGMPSEGGAMICEARYDKGSVWNTYQEASYKLPRKLRGVTCLCLVFRQKVHIKGFRFTGADNHPA
jgi:beta-galactosidase